MTPDESAGPLVPQGSDNPRLQIGNTISFRNWFQKITDWIEGMSPAGATVYDTGLLTDGLAFTPWLVKDITYRVFRRGKVAVVRVDCIYDGPTITVGSSGNVVDQPLFYLPAGWWPIDVTYDAYLGAAALYRVGPKIEPNGLVSLVDGPPGVTINQGDPLRLNARLDLP